MTLTQEELSDLINSANMDIKSFKDASQIELSGIQGVHLQQIMQSELFQDWIKSLRPCKLLVRREDNNPATLTYFCSTMSKMLRTSSLIGDCIAVEWWCGMHINYFKPYTNVDTCTVAGSLIWQLLQQRDFFRGKLPDRFTAEKLVNNNKDEQLQARLNLLWWLLAQLPETTTVAFIVDNTRLYRNEEESTRQLNLIAHLLTMATPGETPDIKAKVKALFTVGPGMCVKEEIFDEEEILDYEAYLKEHPVAGEEIVKSNERDGGFFQTPD